MFVGNDTKKIKRLFDPLNWVNKFEVNRLKLVSLELCFLINVKNQDKEKYEVLVINTKRLKREKEEY